MFEQINCLLISQELLSDGRVGTTSVTIKSYNRSISAHASGHIPTPFYEQEQNSLDAGSTTTRETERDSQSADPQLCLSWHVFSVTEVSKKQIWFICPV